MGPVRGGGRRLAHHRVCRRKGVDGRLCRGWRWEPPGEARVFRTLAFLLVMLRRWYRTRDTQHVYGEKWSYSSPVYAGLAHQPLAGFLSLGGQPPGHVQLIVESGGPDVNLVLSSQVDCRGLVGVGTNDVSELTREPLMKSTGWKKESCAGVVWLWSARVGRARVTQYATLARVIKKAYIHYSRREGSKF